jgi:rod shape-determining protein MreD
LRLTGILGLTTGLFLVLALQAALFSALRLPLASPDLLLVVVTAIAFAWGPRFGLVTGFCVGLAADVVPPAAHAIGRQAFVLCLIGYLAGRAAEAIKGSAVRPILCVACLAASTPFLYALLGFAVGDGSLHPGALVPTAVGSAIYAAILAPFVVPVVDRIARRNEPRGISTLPRPGISKMPKLSKGRQ